MYEVFDELLKSFNVDTATICRELDISQSTISNWKKRNNLISAEIAIKLAGYFGVTLDYLYTGKESSNIKKTHLTVKEFKLISDIRTLNDEAYDMVSKYIEFQIFEGNTKKIDQTRVV